jgi:deoxyribonuclease V
VAVKDASEFNALRQVQTNIAKQVVLEDPASEVASIGAVAQSFDESLVFSSAVVVDTLMNVIDESASITKTAMPYVPGLLFFREGPAVIATVEKLRRRPDVLIVHGCGINHPRFAGLASHVGVILNTSTVGVSKKALCGKYVEPAQAGRPTALTFNGKPLGFVLKTVAGTKPIFISPGNRISLQGALRIVQHCVVNHRLPEPLRLAHIKARHLRSEMRSGELWPQRAGDGWKDLHAN